MRRLRLSLLVLAVVLPACGATGTLDRSSDTVASMDRDTAVAAGERFLTRHLADDGRIVRHDHGGDTVSEGQAYGMLVAVALRDRDRFERIWDWTRTNLRRDDGLLSWRWERGAVADPMPATDADVDAAHALTLASYVFAEPSYARAAAEIADAIVEHEVVRGRLGPVAVAGPWAVEDRWVNPSYGAPVAFAALADLTGNRIWTELDDGARRVVAGSSTPTDLVPDWALLTDDAIEPSGPPSGGDAFHGYDAARTAVRFAVDCDRDGRSLAAAMDDEYDAAALDSGAPAAVLSLDGRPRVDHGHAVTTVAAAAASLAAGDREDAARLLTIADRQDDEHPTYYGSAWVALGRLWLSTGRLGGCAPD